MLEILDQYQILHPNILSCTWDKIFPMPWWIQTQDEEYKKTNTRKKVTRIKTIAATIQTPIEAPEKYIPIPIL